ncbi:hypothetical protein [Chelatococcus sp.]|uniref:hypothetical protein n=1 Tax=Chelatococcus sp. TaxID=1953771 RepID=UPI001ECF7ADF|nr:hypothetical protein [Chelatococcus sp.]MBX3547455.1 hypothetical protein [Chelatococcus sp.]CAH1678340.1 hypothetical protein CHELA41_24522 [Hyphomicrobiales bacterium]
MSKADDDTEFCRGYVIAVSNQIGMHGTSQGAAEIMRELGIKFSDLKKYDLCEYDRTNLAKLYRYNREAFEPRSTKP